MGIKKVFCLFMVGIFAFFASPVAEAGSSLDKILKVKKLVVGTSPEYPPLSYKKGNEIVGFEPTLAKIIAHSMGVELQLVEMEFHDLLPALKEGKLDMVLSAVTMTQGRNLHVAFVGPYLTSGQNILASREKVENIHHINDMNRPDFTLAVNKGTTGEATARAVLSKAKIIVKDNLTEALQLLLDGKADAIMADDPYIRVMELKHRGKGLASSTKPFTFEPFGIAIPGEDSLYLNWLQNFMLTMERSGRLQTLVTTWYSMLPAQMNYKPGARHQDDEITVMPRKSSAF